MKVQLLILIIKSHKFTIKYQNKLVYEEGGAEEEIKYFVEVNEIIKNREIRIISWIYYGHFINSLKIQYALTHFFEFN